MSRLRTYAPMNRKSEKLKRGEPSFRAVYTIVDQRSGGRCEVNLYPAEPRLRCNRQATDHHHLYKPRRSHHTPMEIVHLCRSHHDRTEWPYHRGRLVIDVDKIPGLPHFEHLFRIAFASDKVAARGAP